MCRIPVSARGGIYKIMGRDIIKKEVHAELLDPPYKLHIFPFGTRVLILAAWDVKKVVSPRSLGAVTWL